MALFKSTNEKEKKHTGFLGNFAVDVIKWEPEADREAGILVHKYEYEDFPSGSYLIVGPSQMAVFVNNLEAGNSALEGAGGNTQVSVFLGACKIRLETGDSRFAPFRNLAHTLTGGESAFHSTVYFINTTYLNELSWGTQEPILVQDPEEEVNVHVRAFGAYGVHIEQRDTGIAAYQARKFLQKVVGTRADFTREEMERFMRAKILEYVPNLLANSIIEQNIGVLKLPSKLSLFSDILQGQLFEHFDQFGLTLDNFSFHSINVPDADLRELNEMKIKRKRARLEAEGAAMKMDIESAARARMREREGYTYQQEQAFGVMGTAAANEGTGSTFLGAGMGLGMGVGLGGTFGAGMGALARETVGNVNLAAATTGTATTDTATTGTATTGTATTDTATTGMATTGTATACPSCGKENPAGAKFCFECGGKLAKKECCPDCGSELIPGAKFCFVCGRRLAPAVCPGCGKELVPGARFCLECGMKLS